MTFDVALNRLWPAKTVSMHQKPNPVNPVNPVNPARIYTISKTRQEQDFHDLHDFQDYTRVSLWRAARFW